MLETAGSAEGGEPPFNVGIYIMLVLVLSVMGILAGFVVRAMIKENKAVQPTEPKP